MRKFHLKPKRIIVVVAVVAITIFLIWLLFGVAVDLFLPQRLAATRDLWANQRPDRYRLTVRVYGFCPPPCGNDLQLIVNGDQVTEASQRSTFLAGYSPDNTPFEPIAPADYAQNRV